MSLRCLAAASLALAAAFPLCALADTAAVDSTVTTVLPELVVSGEAAAPPVPGHAKISEVEVNLQDPASLADLGALLPSARVSTNSRGDRHLMIRGAPERHVPSSIRIPGCDCCDSCRTGHRSARRGCAAAASCPARAKTRPAGR